jgi:cbb3-type cytochrome oxidase subunit 3
MGRYGMPYDSTIGVAPIWGVVSFCILLYIVLRVWWQLNRDKKEAIESNSLKKNIVTSVKRKNRKAKIL